MVGAEEVSTPYIPPASYSIHNVEGKNLYTTRRWIPAEGSSTLDDSGGSQRLLRGETANDDGAPFNDG